MPVSTRSGLGARPISIPTGFNDLFAKKPVAAAAPPFVSTESPSSQETSASSNHLLAFRLLALALVAYTTKFVLGMVRYVLDLALILLVLSSVVAVVRPGPKDGAVSQVLAHVESVVNPLFSAMADRGVDAISGHIKTAARYLGLLQAPSSAR
ncbi:hypothetical protein GGI25_003479 [Coemansia spiralis]|uniref:Uncharacterized protein n=2 Tax=Coemansia TaxID=4863 RepID=A0A9W8G1Z3_9FUNG|nr:hypothetical protein BX070DRAFT_235429 [Coemansia spiralis]KAJ1991496.1 hypothetical protein EDC05_003420 [Coemansia umbellata]KAJ2621549.1 hypothetical protein GGI26_004012 [Coemansia sp. RSA 1358]KAJ2676727.1 hypothetical protein GGI25_003479 [Coemansia spiralis]